MRRRKGSFARVRVQDRVLSGAPTTAESALTGGYLRSKLLRRPYDLRHSGITCEHDGEE
jgi:hypothetical protein